jgi:hypothetical protein
MISMFIGSVPILTPLVVLLVSSPRLHWRGLKVLHILIRRVTRERRRENNDGRGEDE